MNVKVFVRDPSPLGRYRDENRAPVGRRLTQPLLPDLRVEPPACSPALSAKPGCCLVRQAPFLPFRSSASHTQKETFSLG